MTEKIEGNRKLVRVEWVDSHSGKGWADLDRIKASAELLHIVSVGWVIAETKDQLVLCSTLSDIQGTGDISIPKCCITKRRTL